MCGLVSIAGNLDGKAEKAFKTLLILDSLRGEDSTGVLSVAKHMDHGEKIAKQVGDPFMLFDHKSYDQTVTHRASRVLIGHNRYATSGGVTRSTAHPFEFPTVIGVHNGTLTNKHYFDKDNRFQVDSEALYNCIDLYGIDEAIDKVKGAYALVWWDKVEQTINYIRNKERPLWFALTESEDMIFAASEPWMINIATGRNGIKMKDPVQLEEDTLLSVPVPKGGKLGKPEVRTIKQAVEPPKVMTTYPSFPKEVNRRSGTTNRTSPTKGSLVIVPNETAYADSKMDLNFMSAQNVTLEAVAVMKDKHQAEYMLCFCPDKPFYEIRLYNSVHTDVLRHAGCEFIANISSFTSVSSNGGGYYKVSPHGCRIQTYQVKGVIEDKYPTHDGKYLGRTDWMGMYGVCAFCNATIEPEDMTDGAARLTSMGDGLCADCVSSDEVKPYVQLVDTK